MLHAHAAKDTKKKMIIIGLCPNKEMDWIVANGLLELEVVLKKWTTPIAVAKALMHGIRNWRQCQKGVGTAIEWSDDDIITRNNDRDTADELGADELVQKLKWRRSLRKSTRARNIFPGDL
jgi:hypothetical protein